MNRDGIFMGRGAARGMENCSGNGTRTTQTTRTARRKSSPVRVVRGIRVVRVPVFIGRGGGRGMGICLGNALVGQVANLSYISTCRGAARRMRNCSAINRRQGRVYPCTSKSGK